MCIPEENRKAFCMIDDNVSNLSLKPSPLTWPWRMSASSAQRYHPSLLSLPDEVLSKIFKHLADEMKYTLQSSVDALNFARCNSRLQRIFGTHLTSITPITEHQNAPTLYEEHIESLVRIAGTNLRELRELECTRAYFRRLPEMCPNLEAFSYVCMHLPDPGPSTPDEHSVIDDVPDIDDMDDEDADNSDAGDRDYASLDPDEDSSDGDVMLNEDGGSDPAENEAGDSMMCEADERGLGIDDVDGKESENDGADGTRNAVMNENDNGDSTNVGDENVDDIMADFPSDYSETDNCEAMHVLPRLNLRSLSIFGPCDKSLPVVVDHTVQEVHLYDLEVSQLALITPLLSRKLNALSVTLQLVNMTGNRVLKFVNALREALQNIKSLKFHVPPCSPKFGMAVPLFTPSPNFPARAISLIKRARENTSHSMCTKVDLSGSWSFRLLSSVNRNASISLSLGTVTVRDDGNGACITSLPLVDSFLNEDVKHLKKAYLVYGLELGDARSCTEGWGGRLAGHELDFVRIRDYSTWSGLKLKTKKLELYCSDVTKVRDWSLLSGVRELYLSEAPQSTYDDELKGLVAALAPMVDAFQGKLIWIENYFSFDCGNVHEESNLRRDARLALASLRRFVARGGDAATLQDIVEGLLEKDASQHHSDLET